MSTIKTPEQIGREVIDANYGIGTEWEEPNQFGEEGFTRAQAESDIDADDIRLLIEQAVNADRAQWFDTASSASRQHFIDTGRYLLPDGSSDLDDAPVVITTRPLIAQPRPTLHNFVEAYERYTGDDVDGFVLIWRDYLEGTDTPCPDNPSGDGMHAVTSGSCDYCGDKNRG